MYMGDTYANTVFFYFLSLVNMSSVSLIYGDSDYEPKMGRGKNIFFLSTYYTQTHTHTFLIIIMLCKIMK